MAESTIVKKLWNLCTVLKNDGVSYMDYLSELTFVLFPKMLQEKGLDEKWLPKGYRWEDLSSKEGVELYTFYKKILFELGNPDAKLQRHQRVIEIYADAHTRIKEPRHLAHMVSEINKLDWYTNDKDDLGDMYEGLLEKMASEKKSGAGQYFTPRPLIDSMVELLQPQAGELVQDAAAGTCGFLIAADKYVKRHTKNLAALSEAKAEFQRKEAFYGVEFVPDTHRMALMNLMLHDLESDLQQGNSLGETGASLKKADLILSNPPFGISAAGGGPTRTDFTFATNNKQLAFVQHFYRNLKPGGRAGIVIPDNVLFEGGQGAKIREDLLEKCNLHTILRLPTGIFYAQGVKTNVLFFEKGKKETGNTKEIWIYDLRSNMPSFGKTTPLKREHFSEFEKAYGSNADGSSKRKDEGENGRFRKFSIEDIKKRNDFNLDISWLKDDSAIDFDDLPEPDVVAEEILKALNSAVFSFANVLSTIKARPGKSE